MQWDTLQCNSIKRVINANLAGWHGGEGFALRFNALQFDANNPLQPNGLLSPIQPSREIHICPFS